jgi:hypothetical protein
VALVAEMGTVGALASLAAAPLPSLRLLKKDVKDARRAAAIAFLIERHAEIAKLMNARMRRNDQ